MMYRLLSFAALLLALHCALAMPNHPAGMLMSGELSHEIEQHNDTAANATTNSSMEDDDDDDADDDGHDEEDDDDYDDIHVQGKSSSCPPRQPEIVEVEKQCQAEYKMMKKKITCSTTAAPTTEGIMTEKQMPGSATMKVDVAAETASEGPTDSPTHKHRARMPYYYHCILKKMDLLNEAGVPCKLKLEAWVATNVTDETQRGQTMDRLKHCLSELKDELDDTDSSTESSDETEQSTELSSKKQDQQNCDKSKKLLCCLHHVECPVIKYP